MIVSVRRLANDEWKSLNCCDTCEYIPSISVSRYHVTGMLKWKFGGCTHCTLEISCTSPLRVFVMSFFVKNSKETYFDPKKHNLSIWYDIKSQPFVTFDLSKQVFVALWAVSYCQNMESAAYTMAKNTSYIFKMYTICRINVFIAMCVFSLLTAKFHWPTVRVRTNHLSWVKWTCKSLCKHVKLSVININLKFSLPSFPLWVYTYMRVMGLNNFINMVGSVSGQLRTRTIPHRIGTGPVK